MDFLTDIINEKRAEIEGLKKRSSREGFDLEETPEPLDFLGALDGDGTKIIAEIKKASPSRGVICRDFDPVRLATSYKECGASALSILTEKRFFQGEISYIGSVKRDVSLPVLRKDFILDEIQIWESLYAGADAILLIARILSADRLKELVSISLRLGLTPLVEVHDEEDLSKALSTDTRIIGVNNRDLKTFKTDIGVSKRLKPLIPDDRIAISESGISTRDDIELLEGIGFKGFLIGESLLSSGDTGKKLRELLGICAC